MLFTSCSIQTTERRIEITQPPHEPAEFLFHTVYDINW